MVKVTELNRFGVTNKDVADILQRSASAMSSANNTLEETIALGTAASEITRDAEAAGTMLKTLSMRVRSMDEDTGEFDETLANLGTTIKSITGVSVFTDASQETYKSTYQILREISQVWDKLTDENRADVLELLAGKRQGNQVAAILQNWTTAEKALTAQAESAGGALREQATYMESITARINTFKETITGLWQGAIDKDAIKFGVDIGTKLVQVIDLLVNKTGSLIPILLTATSLYAGINALKKTHLGLSIKETAATIRNIVSTYAQTAAWVAETFAVNGLHAGLLALKTAFMGVLAANPLLWIGIAATAVFGLVKGIQELTTSYNEQVEIVENLKSKYSELQTEQDGVVSKIKELEGLGLSNLSDEQKAYYDSLVQTNDQLSLEIQYQKTLLEIANENLTKRAAKRLNKLSEDSSLQFKSSPDGSITPYQLTPVDKLKESTLIIQDYNNRINELFVSYKNGSLSLEEYNKQLNTLKTEKNNVIAETESLITSVQEEADNIYDTSGAFNELKTSAENAVTEAMKAVAGIDAQAEAVKAAEQKVADAKAKLDIIWASKGFETAKSEIKSLIEAENLNKDTVMDLANRYPILYGYLRQTGVSIDDLIPQFVSLNIGVSDSNTELSELIKSFSDVVKEIDTFNSALEEQEKNGSVSIDTFLSMVSSNEKLVSVFKFEHGQIKLNKEAYQLLTIAKIQEMQATKIAERQGIIDKIKEEYKAVTDLVKAYNNAFINQMFVQQIEDSINDRITNATKNVNIIIDAMQKIMDSVKNGNFDLTPDTPDTSRDPWLESFNKSYKELKYLRDMDKISAQEYYDRLDKLNKDYFDNNAKYLDEYRQYEVELYNLKQNFIKELADAQEKAQKEAADNIRDNAKAQKDALEDILDLTKDLIKQEVEDKVSALEKVKDSYSEIISAKKKSLEMSKKENDYGKELAEKVKQQAKLEADLNLAKLDTSREGQAKQTQLLDALTKLRMETADFQEDYALEKTMDALDDTEEAREKQIDNEIDMIKNTVNTEVKLYQLAVDRIENSWSTLYGQLTDYNAIYGNGIDGISDKWSKATDALKTYSSVQSALSGLKSTSESKSNDELIYSLVDSMKSNSNAYNSSTSDSVKAKLKSSNADIAAQIASLTGESVTRDKNGVWWISGQELYKRKFHTGGLVGNIPSASSDEIDATLKKKEYVLTENNQKSLVDIINSNKLMTNAMLKSAILTNSILPNIGGNVNNNSSIANTINPVINVNITATDLNDRELDKVANTVVSKINGTFSQYGIVNSRNARTR